MQTVNEVPKRVTFPKKLGKPKRLEETQQEGGTTEKDVDEKKLMTIRADAAVNWRAHVKIFLLSTGNDSGSECEIVGWLSFPHPLRPEVFNINDQHVPLFADFSAENDGLGRLYADQTFDLAGPLPNDFQAFLGEKDSGTDWILAFVMDWTDPANNSFRDGGAYVWTSTSGDDNSYKAHMWVQVTTF